MVCVIFLEEGLLRFMVGKLNQKFCSLSRVVPLVLIVDDDRDNLLFISCILDALNLDYISAISSGEAINFAINQQPNLILLDIVMPEIDGMEITRRLKENSFTKHIPIVAVTGLTLDKHKQIIQEAGCDGYICKPFLIEEMEQTIASFLNICLI